VAANVDSLPLSLDLFLLSICQHTLSSGRGRRYLHLSPCPKHPTTPRTSGTQSSHITTLPADAVPVDCTEEPHKIVIPVSVSSLAPSAEPPQYAATWTAYVATLPSWEQDLLASIIFVDRRSLLVALRSNGCIFLASDGGAADRLASFGAVLATHDTILIECGGRAPGANPRSFRAEGYGILAILRLTYHLRSFYVTRNPNLRFRLYCDNESLLKRITASSSLKRSIPRRFLFSEADVEMQILASLQALLALVAFEHVEGHQDTKYPDEPLSWSAQLNQRCDEIATAHLDLATEPMPTVPFLPASTVSISVGAHTITHYIPTQFRTFDGLAGIRQHLCTHHEWEEPTIFDLVDWPVFHSASLATTFLKRLFGIKMIHFLLPLQKQQYQFRLSPSASCPSACGCPEEDWACWKQALGHRRTPKVCPPTGQSTSHKRRRKHVGVCQTPGVCPTTGQTPSTTNDMSSNDSGGCSPSTTESRSSCPTA
jgi:hypothetical protein